MELRHFRYFSVIAEMLSFSKASQVLRVAQPALSKQIKDFETELGFSLFERGNRTIRLTNPGKKLLQDWKRINNEITRSIVECGMLASDVESLINFGFIGSPSYFFLSEFIKEFHRKNENIRLKLFEGNQTSLLRQLQEGTVEITLNRPVAQEAGIIQEAFYSDKLYFVSEHDYADNSNIPRSVFILSETADLYIHRLSTKALIASHHKMEISQIDNVQVAISMVKAGLGMAILPGSVALSGDYSLKWATIKGIEIFLKIHYLKGNERKLQNILSLLHEESLRLNKRLQSFHKKNGIK